MYFVVTAALVRGRGKGGGMRRGCVINCEEEVGEGGGHSD